jgi:hypothetical protein
MRSFLFATLFIISAPAVAQQKAPPSSEKPAAEKKVCRQEQPTGSRMVKRTCHTPAEWAVIDANNASDAARALDQQQGRRN